MRRDTIGGMTFGKPAQGQLIASVRYGATAHQRAMKHGASWWFNIRLLGKNRMLTCDCGGTVQDRPAELTYDNSWGGCSHIVALYKGNVTTDMQGDVSGDYRLTSRWSARPLGTGSPIIFFVRLSTRGEKMFYWRWTALRLA